MKFCTNENGEELKYWNIFSPMYAPVAIEKSLMGLKPWF